MNLTLFLCLIAIGCTLSVTNAQGKYNFVLVILTHNSEMQGSMGISGNMI